MKVIDNTRNPLHFDLFVASRILRHSCEIGGFFVLKKTNEICNIHKIVWVKMRSLCAQYYELLFDVDVVLALQDSGDWPPHQIYANDDLSLRWALFISTHFHGTYKNNIHCFLT